MSASVEIHHLFTQHLQELLWLTARTHAQPEQVDLGEVEHVTGQRNIYARAAAIVAATATGKDPAVIADRLVDALTQGTTDPYRLVDLTLSGPAPESSNPPLEWIGPTAFAARHGHDPGVDRDHGNHWGPNHDQRICFRRRPGSPDGLLYVYDPTWDEYAVLHRRVHQHTVRDVFLAALTQDEHLPAADFALLLAIHLARASKAVSAQTSMRGLEP